MHNYEQFLIYAFNTSHWQNFNSYSLTEASCYFIYIFMVADVKVITKT